MNQKELFFISLTVFLTIIAWMLVEAFKIDTAVKTEKEEKQVIEKKINLDNQILKILKNRQSP